MSFKKIWKKWIAKVKVLTNIDRLNNDVNTLLILHKTNAAAIDTLFAQRSTNWLSTEHSKVLNTFVMNAFLNNSCGSKAYNIDVLLRSQNIMGVFYDIKLNDIHMYLKLLFVGRLHSNSFDVDAEYIDVAYIWGIKPSTEASQAIATALQLNIPVLIIEDGFLRSACTWADETKLAKYYADISFTVDDLTAYYDARHPSRLEIMLNDTNFIITDEQKERALKCINTIVKTHLTKYNHQPIYTPNIGRKNVKKVLVADQHYGDMSVVCGLASKDTFMNMLECAIAENPDADIIVKLHPDVIGGYGGYYTELKQHDNVYTVTAPINPISLIEYCDKIYVCTTQLGMEALMCNKEVHVFGIPFYAGWGLTHDRQKCDRRTNKRTIEELFYIVYIVYTRYVNPGKQSRCEIEDAITYLLSLREEYFTYYNN